MTGDAGDKATGDGSASPFFVPSLFVDGKIPDRYNKKDSEGSRHAETGDGSASPSERGIRGKERLIRRGSGAVGKPERGSERPGGILQEQEK